MESPLKLGILCHPTFGGSGVVASELGVALAQRGHSVHIFSHRRPIRIPLDHPKVTFHEVEVTTYPLFKYPPYALSLATKLAVTCKEVGLDLLHSHYAIPHAMSAYLCRQMIGEYAPKIVTTLHGTDITLLGLDDSFFEITRFSILQSDGVTAVSQDLARQTEEDFQLDRKVEVIPNFIDTERFHPKNRNPECRARFVGEGEYLVGHVSNFREVKRVLDVIRIFHGLHYHVPCRLLMVGDGPLLEPAKALVGELGLQEKVEFLGLKENIPQLLPQLDLFVLPSAYESFGLAALEAMACGVPVLASRAGGLPEVVEEGQSGFLGEVGDIEGMTFKAREALEDPRRLQLLRTGARHRAEQIFPQDRIIDTYESFYRQVLEKSQIPNERTP